MPDRLEQAITRFVSSDGSRVVGTGFVVAGRYIVTCTHVLNSALGIAGGIPLASVLRVAFPLNPQLLEVEETVVASFPVVENPDIHTVEDISVLEMSHAPLPSLTLMPLAMSDYHGRTFRTMGFNGAVGSWFQGQCAGVVGDGRIQLQVDNSSNEALNGLSGAPVWDTQANAVTGMLVAKRGNLKSYMIPASRLLAAWSALGSAVQLPPVVLSAFQQQQYADLAKRRSTLQELLSRQQEELIFEDDPKRQMRLERAVKITQASLAQVETALQSIVHVR